MGGKQRLRIPGERLQLYISWAMERAGPARRTKEMTWPNVQSLSPTSPERRKFAKRVDAQLAESTSDDI